MKLAARLCTRSSIYAVCIGLLILLVEGAESRGTPWGVPTATWRGGAKTASKPDLEGVAFAALAKAIQPQLSGDGDASINDSVEDIAKALKSVCAAQGTLKGVDGVAHAAYRSLRDADSVDMAVSGRARRSAMRINIVAHALAACEWVELLEHPVQVLEYVNETNCAGPLSERKVLVNTTMSNLSVGFNVNLLVLHEESFEGGGGVHHIGIDKQAKPQHGRLVIVIGDDVSHDMGQMLRILEKKPSHVKLTKGMMTAEAASVQSSLHEAAGAVLLELEPLLREYNTSAVHFVGRSLGGGIASLAAAIFDGSLPLPSGKKGKRSRTKRKKVNNVASNSTVPEIKPLAGLGKDRVSALSLGAPPSMSANVPCSFVTSVAYGDDIVCRASPGSVERLLKRTRKALGRSGIIGLKQLNRFTDTVAFAATNVREHAHGSEGEEAKLSIPGNAYLIRPRRQGHATIHEIGSQLKGGREALRAAVLWQLNDILLSKSLWKHHQLDSYIHGIDRVHLRGVEDDEVQD